MHDADESGYEKRARAGLIPFMWDGGELKFLVMISSDPKFGGPWPMISKGKIEEGETKLDAAVREAIEELGFRLSNARGTLREVSDERVSLRSGAYDLAVFGVEVIDKYDFDKWQEETEYVAWYTLEDFRAEGRRDHVRYIQRLDEMVRGDAGAP
jgi:8-oxo-dGTP pyrophosphatase MutT (NUDIX family)